MEHAPQTGGHYQRRILAHSACDIHVAVRKPSNTRLIRFAFAACAIPPDYELPEFRVLGVTREDEGDGNSTRHVITLHAAQENFNEVFTRLVEDIATKTGSEVEKSGAARVLRSRLAQWQRLLQKDRANGLSPEEQRGLYGELYILETFVLTVLSPMMAVQAWTGPDGSAKDFQFSNAWGVEVKTSLARPPHEISITSERQLDDVGLDALYLLHCLVDAQRGAGETLPDRVDRLRHALSGDAAALGLFEDRLLDAGYFEAHVPRYRDIGYVNRSAHLYHVREGFPRLIQPQLPAGVGHVEYVISASACAGFSQPVTLLEQRLQGQQK
jgi:hypothetical protein